MITTTMIADKIHEVIVEMKQTGLWKMQAPEWVTDYSKQNIASENDFSDWLQFVYLPNLLQQANAGSPSIQKSYIVLQAAVFYGEDMKKGKLLQLLIELEAFF